MQRRLYRFRIRLAETARSLLHALARRWRGGPDDDPHSYVRAPRRRPPSHRRGSVALEEPEP
ncbi:MAG: hypothetical protein HYS04_13880 [Acidobacteria bacterium]|nr:hypothetical protein [Acidobacteriota bacterium]